MKKVQTKNKTKGLFGLFATLALAIGVGLGISKSPVQKVNADEVLYHQTGFETSDDSTFTANTTYNANRLGLGPTNFKWDFLPGSVTSTASIVPNGGQAAILRPYNNGVQTPSLVTKFSVPNLTKVTFIARRESGANTLTVSYSIDGTNWEGGFDFTSLTTTENTTLRTYTVAESGFASPVFIRFQITSHSTDKKGFTIDDIKFYRMVDSIVPVNGVNLSSVSASLAVFESLELTATVLPSNATDKAVTWETSDESIATVTQGGLVKAIAPGSATITVKTVDGNKTASCLITVNNHLSYSESSLSFSGWSGSYNPYDLTDNFGNSWAINVGQLNQGVSYLGVNATQVAKSVAEGKFSPFAGLKGDSSYIAIIMLEDYAVQNLTKFKVDWTTIAGSASIGLAYSANGGTTYQALTTETSIAADGSIEWTGTESEVMIGVYLRYNAAASIRNFSITFEGDRLVVPSAQPSSVAISGPTSCYVGDSVTLSAIVLPSTANQSVTWSSLDTAKATVNDEGVVTTLTLGSVLIKATASNGINNTYEINILAGPDYQHIFISKVNVGDNALTGLSWEIVAQNYKEEKYESPHLAFTNNMAQLGSGTNPLTHLHITSDFLVVGDTSELNTFKIETRAVNTTMTVTFIDYLGAETELGVEALDNTVKSFSFALDPSVVNRVGRISLSFEGMTAALYLGSFEIWLEEEVDPSLSAALLFANNLEKYKSCTEAGVAFSALNDDYEALSTNSKAHLASVLLRDFSSEDYSLTFGRDTSVSAINKWHYVTYLASLEQDAELHKAKSDSNSIVATIVIGVIGLTTLTGYYFLKKKKEV